MPELTVMENIDPERVDGVKNPANGFPILLMKATAAGTPEVPSTQDGANGHTTGQTGDGDADDAGCGCCDDCTDSGGCGCCVDCVTPALTKELTEVYKAVEGVLYKRDVSTAERKKLASEGKALSDGSYPIANKGDLDNAASLARSGHGNVAAAKRLIAKRARELGVSNPLDEKTEKETEGTEPEVTETPEGGQEAAEKETGTSEATEPQGDEQPDIQALVKEAVAEATKSDKEAIKELQDELAKVKATPLPGGPAITAPASVRDQRSKAEQLTKAARYDEVADKVTELDLKQYYRTLAKQAREAAGVSSSS